MGGSFLLFWTPSSPRLSVLLSGLPRLALNEGRTVYIFPLLRGGEAGVDVLVRPKEVQGATQMLRVGDFKIFAFPSSSAIIPLISQETNRSKEEKSP